MFVVVITLLALSAAPSGEAETLFHAGREALQANRVDEACELFERSYRLTPTLGTVLNWATALERSGKTASAFARFTEGLAWAQRTGEASRVTYARQRLDELKPTLRWLRVRSLALVPGLTWTLRGEPVAIAPSSAPVAVDPGALTVVAEAPGYAPTTVSATAPDPGSTADVLVDPRPLDAAAPRAQGKPIWPWVLAGTGAALALGGSLGLWRTLDTYGQLQPQRVGQPPREGFFTREQVDARLAELTWQYPVAWTAFVSGLLALAAGVVSQVLVGALDGQEPQRSSP